MLLKTTQAEGTSLQRHKPNAKIDRNSYLFLPRFGELPQTSTVLQRKNRAPGLFRFYLEGMTFAAQSGIVEKKTMQQGFLWNNEATHYKDPRFFKY